MENRAGAALRGRERGKESAARVHHARRRYLAPLIAGEDYPPYVDGLPDYVRIKGKAVRRKLKTSFKL
jgi:6-phosphofructokinase 1